ncbi:ESX secretion-associated protein EspG [Nocardia sp. NPDC052566]|uniref:ESX secretion-associated protein EspG n=1 Tax=Nocardia sp. NPDC052566 TaxID=3364330 RepID=UPI0037C7CA8C
MKTQTVWDFTPDEFAWVWAETGLDEYPYPISIIESATTQDEYTRLTAEISARYPRHGDPDLTGPLRVLAAPDVRIVCTGRSHNSHKRVRSLATAVGDLGVILFQKSGATTDFGGDLKLVVTRRSELGKHIAATMPAVPAGAAGQMIGYTPRVRGQEPPRSWLRTENGDHPVEERIRLLLRAPRTREGHLRIERHLRAERPHPPIYLSWIDIHTDRPAAGRYLIEVNDNDTTVTPASSELIARELRRRAALDKH